MDLNEYVGMNIKKYRLAYKMTLEELAGLVHKSKSTMSKYEKGLISLDVTTLGELAEVFNISVSQLLSAPSVKTHSGTALGDFLNKQYMYSYDGRSRRVLQSVLEHYQTPDPSYQKVNLFYDVADAGNWGKCKALYAGYNKKYEFIENYTLQNQNNPTEQVLISCLNSLGSTNKKTGLLSGLSYKTMLPVAIKVMISPFVLKEDSDLVSSLLLTKEDIKVSKKYNLYTLDQFLE